MNTLMDHPSARPRRPAAARRPVDRRPGPQAGSLMLAALFLILVVGLLGSVAAHLAASDAQSGIESLQAEKALYLAESGLESAKYQLKAASCSLEGLVSPVTGELDSDESFSVATTDLGEGQFRLISVGAVGLAQRTLQEVVACAASSGGAWEGAIIGCQGVSLNGNPVIDSLDANSGGSSLGNGHVLTINPGAPIDLAGNAAIHGDVAATGALSNLEMNGNTLIQGSVTVTGSINQGGNTAITGSQNPEAAATTTQADCDLLNADDLVNEARPEGSASSYSFQGNGTVDFMTPITFHASQFVLNGNKTVNLHGPGDFVIFVDQGGLFRTNGNARLNLLAGARLTIYLTGQGDFSGNGVVNMGAASDLVIYSNSVEEVRVGGNYDFRGVVYAANAPIDLAGNASFTGSVHGWTVSNSGNAHFFYDEALGTNGAGSAAITRVSWAEMF